jgi:hypothetical protein
MPTVPKFQPGERVALDIVRSGDDRVVGDVGCFVLNAGAEYDLIISPGEYADDDERECLNGLFVEAADLDLEDFREGPVYVLRNMQEHHIRGGADLAE